MLAAAAFAAMLANGALAHHAPSPLRADEVIWLRRPVYDLRCYRRESVIAPPLATVSLICRVTARGRLGHCRASAPVANPDDLACAIKAASARRIRLKTRSGQSVVGRTISFLVRFNYQ